MTKQIEAAQKGARAASDGVALARDNFRADQRPYVWFKSANQPPTYSRGRQVLWDWHFANFGKSPAYRIKITHAIELGEGDPVQGFHVPPTEGAPLVPTEDRFLTAPSSTVVSQETFNQLLSSTDRIELHAIIDYFDSYGAEYRTRICVRHLANGPVQFCEGNEIK